jgi:hypothetical protein
MKDKEETFGATAQTAVQAGYRSINGILLVSFSPAAPSYWMLVNSMSARQPKRWRVG